MPEFNKPRKRDTVPSYQQSPMRAASAPKAAPKPAKQQPKPKPKAAPARNSQRPVQKPAKARRQRRKQNMTIYYMLFLLTSAVVFSVLSATVLFKLEEVIMAGDSIYTYDEIMAASGIHQGENLIRFDSAECKANIIDSLVYIDDLQIKKKLPNKLVISIDGAEEMANIEHNGDYYIISKRGRILGLADKDSENTIIYGYEADEPVIGEHISSTADRKTELTYKLMEAAEQTGLDGIYDIDITDYLSISMNYMDRVELYIGASVELEQKLRAAAELLDKEIDKNEYGALRLIDPLKVVFNPAPTESPDVFATVQPVLSVQPSPEHEQEPENADYSPD